MNIVIDLMHLVPGRGGGIVQLVDGLIQAIARSGSEHQYFLSCVKGRYTPGKLPSNFRVWHFELRNYARQLSHALARQSMDVVFRCFPGVEELSFPLDRQIVLIVDLQHEAFPEFFDPAELAQRRETFATVMGGAGAIATISDFARQTILDHPATGCRDVFLTCPALRFDHEASSTGDRESFPQGMPEGNFFYFPANPWPHKNHERLLKAFARYKELEPSSDVELVLTGSDSGWERWAPLCRGLPVRHMGYVSAATLRELYRRGMALTFFSLYEGFGMPLLEAFSLDTPVVCSSAGSLPEVGGDAVLTCDPLDIESMARGMQRIAADAGLRQNLVERGRERLEAYTWEESARNFIAACERVTSGSGSSMLSEMIGEALPQEPRDISERMLLRRVQAKLEDLDRQQRLHVEEYNRAHLFGALWWAKHLLARVRKKLGLKKPAKVTTDCQNDDAEATTRKAA
ncbi:Mannosylfructose-phosphate synthase [Planctomycetes bacterium Pan216]|uniref:Mannosylfructose-phosphate synthase n=1 Tax=Kolteria novifilia TaxID=2527975 RepID=A0A518B6C6_9BACT|nr:Mannosylfructose-phosphate synthase [Planctomycetes bacterium Pan216]